MVLPSLLKPQAAAAPIPIHGAAAFQGMRKAGRLAAEALDMLADHVKPGVTTEALDRLVHQFAIDHNATPAPLNYRGYPKSICTSVNHVICHGIPGPRQLKDGDIVNIDVTLIVDGWHGDTSRMYLAGKPKVMGRRLIEVTHECLMRGIAAVKPGNFFGDIGKAIQSYAESQRFSVVDEFCGHGVGQLFHDQPNVLHYYKPEEPVIALKSGMIFTIEPMINEGRKDALKQADGWTHTTRDKKLSAQFEHSVGVTETGCEIFTLSPRGIFLPPMQSP